MIFMYVPESRDRQMQLDMKELFIWSPETVEHKDNASQQAYLLPLKASNTKTLSQAIASASLFFSHITLTSAVLYSRSQGTSRPFL